MVFRARSYVGSATPGATQKMRDLRAGVSRLALSATETLHLRSAVRVRKPAVTPHGAPDDRSGDRDSAAGAALSR